MKGYFQQLGNIVYRLLIVLLLYSISRLFFFIANFSEFSGNSVWELLKIFVVGIRFDATPVFEINLILVFLYALPFRFSGNKKYYRILDILFITINALILLLNFTDAEYFKYTGKRSTADLFDFVFMSNDTAMLLPQFLKDFWYVPFFWIVTVALGVVLIFKIPFKNAVIDKTNFKTFVTATLFLALLLGVLFGMARGLGLKPVRIISAARYTSSQNIPLLLNTPFCIIHTLNEKEKDFKPFFAEAELNRLYNPEQQIVTDTIRNDNIVFIILESFSFEFIGSLSGNKTYTPNLDTIISQGLVFDNAFANGKKSIEALPAIFAGLPALTDNPYISSRYASNALEALPYTLAKKGYSTSFFHGGRNGTMGFDEFCHIAGIQKYFGLNEYDGPEAYDGFWGIYDDEFMQFFAKNIHHQPQPFMSAVFTLSSHHPYNVPEKLKHLFPKDESKLEQSIRYADYALGRFFNKIRNTPWYKNTLFVITADHTARDESNQGDKSIKAYRIPIVFYHPGNNNFKGRIHKLAQQTDIMPTIYEYLGITEPFLAFGQSVFSNNTSWALYYLGGIYTFIQDKLVITFDGENIIETGILNIFNIDKLPSESRKSEIQALENKLKAIIQQYKTRLIDNRLLVQKK